MYEDYGDILTIDEVCEILLVGRNTAYKLLNSHKLEAFRIGRTWKIPVASVHKFILQQTTYTK